MNIKGFFGLAVGKVCRILLRLLKRGGTTMPGIVALAIYHDLLGYLAKDVIVIVVTGTNGKTTTSRMIEKNLIDSGMSYFDNKAGANLWDGITTAFMANSTWTGKNKKKYALIECDEAEFKNIAHWLNPKCVVVTNVFRDQLDRYGEITHTLKNIQLGLEQSKEAKVCLNADCSLTASLKDHINNEILFYGVDMPIYKERVKEASDAPYCINCKGEYTYEYITYGHLGSYYCKACGYKKPKTIVSASKIYISDENHSQLELNVNGTKRDAIINLPGGYNIYNAVAATTVSYAMGIDLDISIKALEEFECGFGRMEKFKLGRADTRMILVKNPAGCNQVLNFLSNIKEKSIFVVCLNDNLADGTDISWIWDVDFEVLKKLDSNLEKIYVSGIRADDMAMRFKYAGIDINKLEVIKDYDNLIDKFTNQDCPVYIMPTYTAMMDLRSIVSRKFGYKNFWE